MLNFLIASSLTIHGFIFQILAVALAEIHSIQDSIINFSRLGRDKHKLNGRLQKYG
ncbi:MAG: hypothetical protein JWM28_4399 [Chitinophagaceae bacterium]|nr:hypothetical protein [Chitinophagaceae bacterium]